MVYPWAVCLVWSLLHERACWGPLVAHVSTSETGDKPSLDYWNPDCFLKSLDYRNPDCFLKMNTRSKAGNAAAEPDDVVGPPARAQDDESSSKAPTAGNDDVEHQARFAELMMMIGLDPVKLVKERSPEQV